MKKKRGKGRKKFSLGLSEIGRRRSGPVVNDADEIFDAFYGGCDDVCSGRCTGDGFFFSIIISPGRFHTTTTKSKPLGFRPLLT